MFERSVFINCPFDDEYAPLLEAAFFCIVTLGLTPRLATERQEGGESRLDKIVELAKASKYSIHDLSRSTARTAGEPFRMNMPFELGVDLGLRRSGVARMGEKRFLIFEWEPYVLKRCLSDIAGQDDAHHRGSFESVIRGIRDFLRVEAEVDAPGPSRLISQYATCQAWIIERKIHEGHSEQEALRLPSAERIQAMADWVRAGRPAQFIP